MLKYGEPNMLSIHGLRKLDHCPAHFTKFVFDLRVDEKVITDWIWANLSGRFYFGNHYHVDSATNRTVMSKMVAFELPGETSYFALVLDQINVSQFDF